MSLHSYLVSQQLAADDPPFSALVMAAMRKADSNNFTRLRAVFPDIYEELQERYNAPGGRLPHEAVVEVIT